MHVLHEQVTARRRFSGFSLCVCSDTRARVGTLRVQLDHDAVPLEQITDRHPRERVLLAHLHHRPRAHRQQRSALLAPKVNRVEVPAEEVRQAPTLPLRAQPRPRFIALGGTQREPKHQGVFVIGRRMYAPVLHVAVNLRGWLGQRRRVYDCFWRDQEDEGDATPRLPVVVRRVTGRERVSVTVQHRVIVHGHVALRIVGNEWGRYVRVEWEGRGWQLNC